MSEEATYAPNPAKLRSFYVRLFWPNKTTTSLKIDAIDAWDANALVRLNYPIASPFGFAAWTENHWADLRRDNATPPAAETEKP